MKGQRARGIGPYSRKRRREQAPELPDLERDREDPMPAPQPVKDRQLEPADAAEALRRKSRDRRP